MMFVKTRNGIFICQILLALSMLIVVRNLSAQVFDFPLSTPLDLNQPLDEQALRQQRNAAMFETRGESEKALQTYLLLFQRYPEYDPFYEGIIRNLIVLERFEQGLAFTDSLRKQMLDGGPVNSYTMSEQERLASLVVDGGRFAGRLGHHEEAQRRWNELYALPHPTPNAFFGLFAAVIECRYLDDLEEMVQRARKASGDPTLLAASLAYYWSEHGRVDRATNELLVLLEIQPQQTDNIQRQILGFTDDDEARRQTESALLAAQSKPNLRLPVSQILQAFYFRNRDWDKAYQEVRKIEELGGGSGEALLAFAQTLTAESETELALKVLDDLRIFYPDLAKSPRGLLALGQAWEKSGRYAQADSVYGIITAQPALRSIQEQEALLRQARLRLDHLNHPAEARVLLTEAQARNLRLRNRAEITLLIGDSYLLEGDLQRSRQAYLEAAVPQQGISPDLRSEALVNAAQVDMYLGDFGQAGQRLNEASRSNPQGKLTNDALDMMELLRVAADDSSGLAALCRADLFQRQKHPAAAESLYMQLTGMSRNGEIIQKVFWRLAHLLRASGRSPEALNRLEEILKRYPQSVRAAEYLLQIGLVREEDLGDIKGAIEAYEKILMDYPESLAAQDVRRRIRRLEKEQT